MVHCSGLYRHNWVKKSKYVHMPLREGRVGEETNGLSPVLSSIGRRKTPISTCGEELDWKRFCCILFFFLDRMHGIGLRGSEDL